MKNGEFAAADQSGKEERGGASKKFSLFSEGCGCLVLLVIAMASASVFPWGSGVMKKVPLMHAKNDVLHLKNAIGSFFVEYRKYPDFPSPKGTDFITDSGMLFLSVILAEDKARNPREIPFFAGKPAKSHGRGWRNGVHRGDDGPELFDPWGNLYLIVWDANCDGQVANPDAAAAKTTPFIPSGVLVWSAGPDGDPDTWADNITTWAP